MRLISPGSASVSEDPVVSFPVVDHSSYKYRRYNGTTRIAALQQSVRFVEKIDRTESREGFASGDTLGIM